MDDYNKLASGSVQDIKPCPEVGKVVAKRKELPKKEESSISGREIIEGYISMKDGSLSKYLQICFTLETFETWSEESRSTFLLQFLDCHDILDWNCVELVHKICKIRWHTVPSAVLPKFVDFLIELAIKHLHHTKQVFLSFVENFSPFLPKDDLSSNLDDQLQESIYSLSLSAIHAVFSYNPSHGVLLKCCNKKFPHIKQPIEKLLPFVRNLVQLSVWIDDDDVAAEIWSLIVRKSLQIDYLASSSELQEVEQRLSICNIDDSTNKDKDIGGGSCPENPMETKLDTLIALILAYTGELTKEELGELGEDPNFKSIFNHRIKTEQGRTKQRSVMFSLLLEAFDEHVLEAEGAHSTPFIWFYLCSLSKENCTKMLEFLWEVFQCPDESSIGSTKAYNAISFISEFLARANYIDLKLCCEWMRRISDWCLAYIDRHTNGEHSLFYTAVQSLLYVFCYRYAELRDQEAFAEVCSWSLDNVINCRLNPLLCISQGIALCFLSINRQYKLVQYKRNLEEHSIQCPSMRKRRRVHLKLFFPFSFCSLKICSAFILPLMRRHLPLQSQTASSMHVERKEEDISQEEGGHFHDTEETQQTEEIQPSTKTDEEIPPLIKTEDEIPTLTKMEEEILPLAITEEEVSPSSKMEEIPPSTKAEVPRLTITEEQVPPSGLVVVEDEEDAESMPIDEGYEEELMSGFVFSATGNNIIKQSDINEERHELMET